MRSQDSTVSRNFLSKRRYHPHVYLRLGALLLFTILVAAAGVTAQKLAILTPEKSGQNEQFISAIAISLTGKFAVLDNELSETAFKSVNPETPFNMPIETARNVGAVIGCQYFLLIRSGTQRRSSLEKSGYYEAFAAVFVVSSRTGRLVYWRLQSSEGADAKTAERLLAASSNALAIEIYDRLKAVGAEELSEKPGPTIEETPPPDSPNAKNFRSPMPYKRIKPEYTNTAYLYSVAATVDVLLDVDEKGNILRLEIARWAGYGLDEAVADTIRKMNWRPGERNGRTLPVQVLLRYNFKKIEKEE